jgi:Phage terminase, small subunit
MPKSKQEPEFARTIRKEYSLSEIESAQLGACVQAYQRWQELSAIIDSEGAMIEGRYANTQRAHPLLASEQIARQAFMRLLTALKIEEEK